MTIIGTPGKEEDAVAEDEPEPDPEPEEPELPPAAEAPPRHVRVLPAADDRGRPDPWEEGFDASETLDETDGAALVQDDAPRRFRRR
jgi:hypothetical protein